MKPARMTSVSPLTCAERISARLKPNVMASFARRCARRAATSASAMAPVSVSMCAASESSASELASAPATTSTTMNPALSASATASSRMSLSGETPWEWSWWWSCIRWHPRISTEDDGPDVKRLYLLRHAKSSWKDPDLRDHDRPLNGRGRRAAKAMARHLRAEGIDPELVLCSPAARARQTLERIEPALGVRAVTVEPRLYGADAETLLALVRALPEGVGSAMVIAHNPGLEDLARLLAGDGPDRYPTGALATLTFAGPRWADLAAGQAELTAFVRPRDLG